MAIRKKVLKYPGYSRLANTRLGGNLMNGEAIESQRKDVFFLSRRDGVHDELWSAKEVSTDYIA